MAVRRLLILAMLASVLAACGSADSPPASGARDGVTVRLVTHDSFSASQSVLDEFRERTGIAIEVVPSGDAGELVNKSALTAGDPLGDVLFGVDNTFLSRALDADLFIPYESPELSAIPDDLELDPRHRVTPVDFGEVCVNYDREAYSDPAQQPPSRLEDLTEPAYRDQLVVENPATSSPGLAFLLATVERFGPEGWEDYWTGLKENGVQIVAGWEEAYNGAFSGGAGTGTRPLVVSYASSPPAEVQFSEAPIDEPTTAVMEDGCFRQVEFAGILRGTERAEQAQAVIDFLLSEEFQADLPLNMFVFPAREKTPLPEVFERFAARPAESLSMEPERIEAGREDWLNRWTELMLG